MTEIDKYGNKECWTDGHLHRNDGPAVEFHDGLKQWWVDGELHRTDGPAIEFPDGSKEWYLYGKELTEEEFSNRRD